MDSFASSIVKNILEKVGSYAYEQIVSAWGLEEEIRKLKNTLEEIQAVLSDAEDRQGRNDEQGKLIKIWLQRFKDVLHDIKDLFDDLEIQDRKMMMASHGAAMNKVRGFFSSSNSIAFRFKMSQRISNIWERLDETKTSKDRFKLSKTPKKEIGMNKSRETHSYVDAHSVIGRDEDVEKIIRSLLKVLGSICESDVGNFVMRCKYLWVLDLSSSSFEELPSSIGQLRHLRYFSLSGNRRIRRLPTSICKLQKLQALGLVGCKKLERLPQGIRNMISLRFLEFTTNEELLPNGEIGCLELSLQVLSISGCQSLKFLFDDMKQLTALKTLSITDCHQLRRLPCSVNDLAALENLLISNCAELDLEAKDKDANSNQDEKLLPSLRSITITKMITFKALPQWVQRSANSLSSLIIEDCPKFEKLPDWLKNFKSLQKLQIIGCPNYKGEA
ncbi:hypothetical protein COLO4_12081 [Corchorus olitorius]|uniref:Uncharacterized protein n=1 Tax=Corchorus olitorius TaxID=93759 RepID=A0A1R3K285_9ROSI|nr:hypothetical protein COLO4_12081 [Corchorus olitorius]